MAHVEDDELDAPKTQRSVNTFLDFTGDILNIQDIRDGINRLTSLQYGMPSYVFQGEQTDATNVRTVSVAAN